eukprot:Skav231688  [mRNA]  locus=scaffold597:1016850:1024273:- [translate_table: standard]
MDQDEVMATHQIHPGRASFQGQQQNLVFLPGGVELADHAAPFEDGAAQRQTGEAQVLQGAFHLPQQDFKLHKYDDLGLSLVIPNALQLVAHSLQL